MRFARLPVAALIVLSPWASPIFGIDVVERPAAVAGAPAPIDWARIEAATAPPPSQPWISTRSLSGSQALVATAGSEVDAYESPGSSNPKRTIPATTILGTPTVFLVVDGPVDGWLEVMLPGLPNGDTGFIEARGLRLSVVDTRIEIDLASRTLTLFEGGEPTLVADVAVGAARNPTPSGSYFVTDTVRLADPSGPWGPRALGLSARSETITEFNGGDGIIGIHGTNLPGSIGRAASMGCIRLPNETMILLAEAVPLGTPVVITG